MANVSEFNINGHQFLLKDAESRETITSIAEAIIENNAAIGTRINNLNERSFDAQIKISSNNESEIASIQDGLYKIQYVTITGSGDEEEETLNNSAILIQQGDYQYLYKNGETKIKLKINGGWYNSIREYYNRQYLTIISLEDNNTILFTASNASYTKTISISTDNGSTWTEKTSSTSGVELSTLNTGDKLLIKGSNTGYGNSSNYNYFVSTANFNAEGNIMSLIYGENFANQTTLSLENTYAFRYLFKSCNHLISAENLILPATTLAQYCYCDMFYGCSALTTAPELPATTLVSNCYNSMFQSCSALTTAPELPATTLADYCYYYMFSDCSSLTIAPELPATTLAQRCYCDMFYGCSALTTAPELPATTLVTACYNYMFSDCSSLITAPELPATTLASNCYNCMFYGCSALTTAPELPATTLADYCYYNMFSGCSSLITAPELPATTLETSCYDSMFYGCSALTTAPKLLATTLASSCYNNMFYGCSLLNYVKCLATDINASYHTTNWLSYVATSGTFIKADNMTNLTSGDNGIPSGWTVYTESEYETINKYANNFPTVTSSDNGKILTIVNGSWALVSPSTLYSGAGVPNNSQGNNGDLFIQTD